MKKVSLMVLGVWVLVGCGSTDTTIDTKKNIPRAVFNQAYQENYQPDSIAEIIAEAKDAYVLVDPFDADVVSQISEIKIKNNSIGGYISAGTGEIYRDDFSELEPYLSSEAWEDWDDEFFVSETTTGIVSIMKKRIDKMATWGLDWVEFDNMDWLDDESRNNYHLKATVAEAKNYINTLCDYTHSKGMKCMAKNTVNGFENFDGVLYESFSSNKNWWNREGTQKFLDENKLVIINHYNERNCDSVYNAYKSYYKSKNISFICEDVALKKYKHYNAK